MAKIVYDTGDMLLAARNMEIAMKEFAKQRQKAESQVSKTRKHTDDPKIREYIDQYEKLDTESIGKLEKNIKSYISTMRSAAKKVAETVKSLDV